MVRAHGPRWVVTDQGVMLSWVACANCHLSNRRDGTVGVGGPRGPRPPGSLLLNPRVPGAQGSPPVLQRYFVGDSRGTIVSRMFATPWALDDRIEHVKNAGPEELGTDPGLPLRTRKGRASTRFRRCVVRGTGHGCCVTDRSRISRRRRSGAPERRLSVKRSVGILSCFFPFVRWATPYIYWQACVP